MRAAARARAEGGKGFLCLQIGNSFANFLPEMVFLANIGVNLHVCLCGDIQVASAQPLDFLGIVGRLPFLREKRCRDGGSFTS